MHHVDRFPAVGTAWRAMRGPLLLLLIYVAFFWKLTLSDQFTWLDSPDFAYQVLPWYQYAAGEFHQGHFPLWDPYEWGGQPFIGQMQPGIACPFNWILFFLPLRNGWIQQLYVHWFYVLLHYLGGLFCYWFCRDLRRGFAASILGGTAFGICGYMGNTDWPQMLNGALWAPLVFLFQFRALRAERPVFNAAFSGACLGTAFLSGHHQIPIFLTVTSGAFWGYFLIQDWKDRSRWVAVAAFGTFLVMLGAVQTLPGFDYGRWAVRWAGAANVTGWRDVVPYSVHAEFSFFPVSILGITIPGIQIHTIGYMGWAVVALACIGLAGTWQDRNVRWIGAMALGGLLLALGQHALVHGWLYALVPLVEKARAPNTAILIFNLSFSVLCAYGLDRCAQAGRFLRIVIGCLMAVFIIFSGFVLAMGIAQAPRTIGWDHVTLSGLAAALVATLLQLRATGRLTAQTASALFVFVVLLENGNVAGFLMARRDHLGPLAQLARHNDIAQFLTKQIGPIRVEVDDQEIPYNFGDWRGMDVFGGYLASMTTNIESTQSDDWMRMLFGVNYGVGKKPFRPGTIEVFHGAQDLKAYFNPDAFPRVWTVHQTIRIPIRQALLNRIREGGPALHQTAFTEGTVPALDSCAGDDRVVLLTRKADQVVIEAGMQCKGMVVLGETWFPGWKAAIDGQPAAIWEVDAALRGVVVPAGFHRIEMVYRPLSVMLGAWMTAMGALGVLALVIWGQRIHR